MDIVLKNIESELFGGNVVQLENWDSIEEIVNHESELVTQFNPMYVYCAVDSSDIHSIQFLESHGYQFSEFRFRSWLSLTGSTESPNKSYPYEVRLLGDTGDLYICKEIVQTSAPDDRFFNDPCLNREAALHRVKMNLEKSFVGWPNEFILGLYNVQTGKMIGFRSGAFDSEKEVTFYLYGIRTGFDHVKYSELLDNLSIQFLMKRGVRIIHAISSGLNVDELNRLIKHHSFKIERTEVFMRKLF